MGGSTRGRATRAARGFLYQASERASHQAMGVPMTSSMKVVVVASLRVSRITSYNVCYTKLLRVGYAEQDEEKTLRPIAWAGFDNGYIATAKLSWSETSEHGRGPAGMVVRSGEPFYVQA